MLYIHIGIYSLNQLRELHHHMFCCFIIRIQMYNRFFNDQKFILKKSTNNKSQ